jgi:hypothetical protein
LLQHFVLFCGRLTKFLAELDANTLLLQHIHFTIRRRDKHYCTADKLTHDWFKLPSAPLLCGVRRCCQVSYMVVTSILLVVSLSKILSRIFLIRPRMCSPFHCVLQFFNYFNSFSTKYPATVFVGVVTTKADILQRLCVF